MFLPAIRNKVQANHDKRHLLTLLFVGAIAIPLFYLASLFIMPNSHVTFADYWRWARIVVSMVVNFILTIKKPINTTANASNIPSTHK
jgi:nitric oxide reductase large subunit